MPGLTLALSCSTLDRRGEHNATLDRINAYDIDESRPWLCWLRLTLLPRAPRRPERTIRIGAERSH